MEDADESTVIRPSGNMILVRNVLNLVDVSLRQSSIVDQSKYCSAVVKLVYILSL